MEQIVFSCRSFYSRSNNNGSSTALHHLLEIPRIPKKGKIGRGRVLQITDPCKTQMRVSLKLGSKADAQLF
jgi:hypothetical protein